MKLNGWYRTFYCQNSRVYIGPWCHAVRGDNTDYQAMFAGMEIFLKKEYGKKWLGSIVVLNEGVSPYQQEEQCS